jgi:hypothetical protein
LQLQLQLQLLLLCLFFFSLSSFREAGGSAFVLPLSSSCLSRFFLVCHPEHSEGSLYLRLQLPFTLSTQENHRRSQKNTPGNQNGMYPVLTESDAGN